jgi:predicted MFS family arabinose efflux permease
MPWGAFFFLNKFLETEKGFSVEVATTIFLVFGIGMVIGTVVGGKLGQLAFAKSNKLLPVFCGITTLIGMAMTLVVVLVNLPAPLMMVGGFLAAFFAAMTGPNMRAMLMDVNAPEKRGAIFSIFNLTDSLGNGIGRWAAGLLSVAAGLAVALSVAVSFWVICGVILCLIGAVFVRDMTAMHKDLEAVAMEMKKQEAKA